MTKRRIQLDAVMDEDFDMDCFRLTLDSVKTADGGYDLTGRVEPLAKPDPEPEPDPPAPNPEPEPEPEPDVPEKWRAQLTPVNDGLAIPTIQATTADIRGWETCSVVYSRDKFYYFGTVKRGIGGRDLEMIVWGEPGRYTLIQDVEQASVWFEDGHFHISFIRLVNGNFQRFEAISKSYQPANFTISGPIPAFNIPYGYGDLHFMGKAGLWEKGSEFPKNQSGDPLDYIRHWYHQGQEVQIDFPHPPTGLRYEIYSMAVTEPALRGWKCKSHYIALLGVFHITNSHRAATQYGTIDAVWATSDDGVHWDLPFGVRPAIDREGSTAKMILPGTLLCWGNQFRVWAGVAHFGHNMWRKEPAQVGTSMFVLPKADFEATFA